MGHDAVIEFWDQWRSAVGQLEFEIRELIEAPPHVLVITRRSGTGIQSGLPVSDEICQVFTFDDGLCVRVQEFYDRTAARGSGSRRRSGAAAERRGRSELTGARRIEGEQLTREEQRLSASSC